MKYPGYIIGAAALAAVANAHTTIWNLYENGVDEGVGNVAGGYIRYPPNNNPVKDITSADMTCNVANTPNTKTVSVAAGSKLSLEWHHDSNAASDDIIASSHKGPVMVYIAPTSSSGSGAVWVKLAEAGYDASTKLWAVDTLIANKGIRSFTLPASLAPGDYLLRGEIIALHEADTAYNVNSARGAQFYMECVQISVTGSGTTTLPSGVAIPGAYSYADPGVVFNLYGSFTSYTIPGPAVWDGTTSGASASTSAVASSVVVKSSSTAAVVVPSSSKVATTSALAQTQATLATSSSSAPAVIISPTPAASVSSTPAAVVASSTKSACKAKTTSSVIAVVSSAPASSKSACKAKTTLQTVVKSSASVAAAVSAVASSSAGTGTVALYGQCGGNGYSGATACASGTCTKMNDYYSQCV